MNHGAGWTRERRWPPQPNTPPSTLNLMSSPPVAAFSNQGTGELLPSRKAEVRVTGDSRRKVMDNRDAAALNLNKLLKS
jgi:hypothetical protein